MIDGCQSFYKIKKLEIEEDSNLKLKIYNEMRDIVINLYKKIKSKSPEDSDSK